MIRRKQTETSRKATNVKSPRNSRAPAADLDFNFDEDPAKVEKAPKQPKRDTQPKQPKVEKAPTSNLKPVALVKGLKELNPSISADQVNAVKLALTLINTVGVDEVIARLNASTAVESVNNKNKPKPRSKAGNAVITFERSTKDFGYRLRDGRADPAELKEKFKSNLERAKKDIDWLRVSHFNKIAVYPDDTRVLIEGIRKLGGEWVFVARDGEGKKVNMAIQIN